MTRLKTVIMGAAGRDFHNFNTYYRDNPDYEVVAFTATQIPNIDGRRYPPELAGKHYPDGIPIVAEEELEKVIHEKGVDQVVFAYSDVTNDHVMDAASKVLASGADFILMGNRHIMLDSSIPVVSIGAVRTGSGKSPTTRKVCTLLRDKGLRVVAVRHPMPYGDLIKQTVQRYGSLEDLELHKTTIEEREEYEPLISMGIVVYAGVDYEMILRQAEKEADVIVWDGGNNDFPFYRSDLHIVIADPHRPGHELSYHPGETNVRMADVIIIGKIQTADLSNVQIVLNNVKSLNPSAQVIKANSPIILEEPERVANKRVLVVEDGPTVTHGGMPYGAGLIAAKDAGGIIIDPRPYAVGSIAETFEKYPHLADVLPAMGYSTEQITSLQETIDRSECDVVVTGTPIDIQRLVKVDKPIIRAGYEMEEIGKPDLKEILDKWWDDLSPSRD
ncbi:MAG: GTPase [Euryarchaeota archaeon]|nr:GTPase [Euryarchaeota archaeon]